MSHTKWVCGGNRFLKCHPGGDGGSPTGGPKGVVRGPPVHGRPDVGRVQRPRAHSGHSATPSPVARSSSRTHDCIVACMEVQMLVIYNGRERIQITLPRLPLPPFPLPTSFLPPPPSRNCTKPHYLEKLTGMMVCAEGVGYPVCRDWIQEGRAAPNSWYSGGG